MTAILYHKDARNMKEIEDETIHLVVTSPPYRFLLHLLSFQTLTNHY